jgi:hypothetical protein
MSAPAHNAIEGNYVHDIKSNANILLRGASQVDVGNNYLANTFAGLQVTSWTDSNGNSGPSVGVVAYNNTFNSDSAGFYIGSDTQSLQAFHNRTINTPQNFSLQGAGAAYDAGPIVGGNFWSDAPGVQPYSFFITDQTSGAHGGEYLDHYPFPNESLGNVYSVAVTSPESGAIVAQTSQKTIAWQARGCVLVDIFYVNGMGNATAIVSNYPSTGYYQWSVPQGLNAGSGYSIRIDCKNSSGGETGVSGSSSSFTIGTNDLVMLSPGRDLMANAGQSVWVAWRISSNTPVNVLLRTDGGAWSTLASNITGTSVRVTLPAVNSNRAQIQVQEAVNPNAQDGTDEHFTIRSGTAVFTNPGSATTFLVGTQQRLEWISPQGSNYVDLSFWDNTAQVSRPIVADLPDYGSFLFLIPDFWMMNGYFQANFKDANGNAISSVQSASVNFFYSGATANVEALYRAYNYGSLDHVYTVSAAEYAILGSGGWSQEGVAAHIYSAETVISGVEAVPFYRFYNTQSNQHLWTADRNEYFTLLQNAGSWTCEGVAGYVLPQSVSGTVAFDRLFNAPIYHLWTASTNESNFLISGGWKLEGVAGYVLP